MSLWEETVNKLTTNYACDLFMPKDLEWTGVVPNSDPCQIITPLGEGLGLGNHIAISTRGVIIWQGVVNGHNTGINIFTQYLPPL